MHYIKQLLYYKDMKEEIKIQAVQAILDGELLLEEAMEKYQVKDKRTVLSWMKKFTPRLRSSTTSKPAPQAEQSQDFDFVPEATASGSLFSEKSLLQKIIYLQDKIQQLEECNRRLLQQQQYLGN